MDHVDFATMNNKQALNVYSNTGTYFGDRITSSITITFALLPFLYLIARIFSAIISNDPYSIKSWTPLWYICSAVGGSGIIIFVAFVKCEEQPWANIQYKDDYPETLTINSEVEDE